MPITIGQRLGPYEIIASIGAGGMGEVYKARDTRLNRDVAIKVLPESFAEDGDRLRRFQLEAQSAGALNHPNILAIYDIGTNERAPYLVSELLEGESLRQRLERSPIPGNKAIDYARQIAAGLAAAHAKGITHRDIKPENLFVTKDGRVKILDFGLAKFTGDKTSAGNLTPTVTSTTPGMVVGTAAYMSPEQARGLAVDHRSDIFSFGCVMYEMFTGQRAFSGNTAADVVSAVLTKEPDVTGKMTPALARIVQHCLEKSPDERLQSARDIAFALEGVTQQDSGLPPVAPARPKNLLPWTIAALALLAVAALAYREFRPAPLRSFHRLTFRRGRIHAARFTPDGNSVVYSAQWEDEPSDLFTTRFDSPGSRALGFSGAELRSISPSGELAMDQRTRIGATPFAEEGMLVRAPFSGGTPRAVEDKIEFAEWSPDGKELALVRETDQGVQLEYPAGKVLYATAGFISEPRISRDGTRVAFLDHPVTNDNRGTVALVDRAGTKKTLTGEYAAIQGVAWSPAGEEVWFTAARTGAKGDLHAVNLEGRERIVYTTPVALWLQDVSSDGRVLFTVTQQRTKMMFRGAGDVREREVSWLDWSLANGMSHDGKFIVFSESGEGAGDSTQVFLRETNGAPAILLGPGSFPVLSPDEQWVVSPSDRGATALLIYPVGPGQSKRLALPGFTIDRAGFLPDGKRIWFNGNEQSHGPRYFLTSLDGSKPRPITPEGVRASTPGAVFRGKFLAGRTGGQTVLYPTDGGQPLPLKGVSDQERIAGWSDDGQAIFIYSRNDYPARVHRVNLKTGKQELIKELVASDRAGLNFGINVIQMTGDGKAYVYSYVQILDELHMVEGLK